MPTVYSYHQVTKIFTDAMEAHESPNEPGVWLLPAFATFIQPPPYMSPQQTPQWTGSGWVIINAPKEQVEEVIFGWTATDAEKKAILTKLANDYMDGAARALGFDSIVDATAMANSGSSTQVGRDAIALKNWRLSVMSTIQDVIASVVGNHKPMPSVHGIMERFPQLVRTFPEPDTTPGKIHEPAEPMPAPYVPPPPYVSPPAASYPRTPPDEENG
jgi:hypothetical protein